MAIVEVEVAVSRIKRGPRRHGTTFDAEIAISGVRFIVRGFSAKIDRAGDLVILPPRYRDDAGISRTAIAFPPVVLQAIGDVLVEQLGRPEVAGSGVAE